MPEAVKKKLDRIFARPAGTGTLSAYLEGSNAHVGAGLAYEHRVNDRLGLFAEGTVGRTAMDWRWSTLAGLRYVF